MLAIKLITLLSLGALFAGTTAAAAQSCNPVAADAPAHHNSTPYSTRMLSSIMLRQQGVVSSGQPTSTLESGLISLAIQSWLSLYASPPALQKGQHVNQPPQNGLSGTFSGYVDSILAAISTTASFTNVTQTARLPLDRLTIAQALLNLDDSQVSHYNGASTHRQLTSAEALALATLNTSLAVQERNQYGGFWYYVYPSWSYLDGTVSFLPFMAAQPTSFLPADTLLQIQLLYANTAHPSGLLAHGYDASKTAIWANNATGASPYVWGRSLGWYLAGLVNAWEVITTTTTTTITTNRTIADALVANEIQTQFTHLAAVLLRFADPATGAWWQLPTLPGAPGNYLESSSTALFTFALLKGLRLDLLPRDTGNSSVKSSSNSSAALLLLQRTKAAALRAYDYTTRKFVVDYGNGTLGYNHTVTVCSLNSSATYEYYVNQPINFNAPLGAAAFVLASLEVERLRS